MKIDVFTDGSATILGRPGGYGWVIVIDGQKHSEGSGHMASATNNDAELESSIQGLAAVLKIVNKHSEDFVHYEVTLISDSKIILGWANGTYRCKQKSKEKKLNQLQFLVKRLDVKTQWVKGHSGNEHNNRCDKLANDARKGVTNEEPKYKKSKTKMTIGKNTTNVFNIWFNGKLKLIDLSKDLCEDHDEKIHGPRHSRMEYRDK